MIENLELDNILDVLTCVSRVQREWTCKRLKQLGYIFDVAGMVIIITGRK